MPKKGSDLPAYLQIVRDLEEQIRDGRYAVGQRLPSETQLAAAYNVSSQPVKRALDHLKIKGLIESSQGKGYYVRDPNVRPTSAAGGS